MTSNFNKTLDTSDLYTIWRKNNWHMFCTRSHIINILKFHVVWVLSFLQCEGSPDIGFEERNLFDGLKHLFVNIFLVLFATSIREGSVFDSLFLSFFLEESGLVFNSSFLLLLIEVFVIEFGIEVDVLDVDSSRSGDHISLVDTSEGDTVDFVRPSDEQEATGAKLS